MNHIRISQHDYSCCNLGCEVLEARTSASEVIGAILSWSILEPARSTEKTADPFALVLGAQMAAPGQARVAPEPNRRNNPPADQGGGVRERSNGAGAPPFFVSGQDQRPLGTNFSFKPVPLIPFLPLSIPPMRGTQGPELPAGGGSAQAFLPGRGTQGSEPPPSGESARAVIASVLYNIKANGFDRNPAIDGGLGGLWINWRFGTNPLQTNFNGTGNPDHLDPPRHDNLTDLRYLHNLWLFKSQHPTDTHFDGQILRYGPIVQYEFGNSHDERGWIYDELIDLYHLSQDPVYQQAAFNLADFYATRLYDPNIGTVYQKSGAHPEGYYNVGDALEAGAALVQAGTTFGEPSWVTEGNNVIQFVYAHAFVSDYHVFLKQMGNVLLPDGTANPDETIFRDPSVEGGSINSGEVALESLSLLHAFAATQDPTYLDRATELLTTLTADQNGLGLWDAQYLGYFANAVFPGPDFAAPGTPTVTSMRKESGRQLQLLEAYHVANAFTGDASFQAMETALRGIAVNQAFYSPGHGYLYEETQDWNPLPLHGGGIQDWVTTEAMGIALEGLQSVSRPDPW